MRQCILPVALALTICLSPARAEQFVQFGNYVAHYNAFTSDMLDSEVASNYGIKRSHNRGVLIVNIQRAGTEPPAGIRAKVEARAKDRNHRSRPITLREVREGHTFYYLADFPVTNGEILDFNISVEPEGAQGPHLFSYRQQFFTGQKSK